MLTPTPALLVSQKSTDPSRCSGAHEFVGFVDFARLARATHGLQHPLALYQSLPSAYGYLFACTRDSTPKFVPYIMSAGVHAACKQMIGWSNMRTEAKKMSSFHIRCDPVND